MLFLPQSLTTLIDFGLPMSLSWNHECANTGFPFVDTEIVREQLYQLNLHNTDRARWDSSHSTEGCGASGCYG